MNLLIARPLLKRTFQPNLAKFAARNCSQPSTPLRFYSTQQNEQPVSKTKQFMKKYGYVGIGVYLALGAVDLGATMALISVKGAERVKETEHYVIQKVKGYIGMEQTPLDTSELNEKPSLTSIFVIAYGIHKTVLLPFRLSLTAAITPSVAKKLAKMGWIQKKLNKTK